jgi:hypothetical protein
MAEQVLKDRNGNKVGVIEIRSDGTQIGKDKNGNRRGEYNPKTNTTKDKNGNIFGKGNALCPYYSVTESYFPSETL